MAAWKEVEQKKTGDQDAAIFYRDDTAYLLGAIDPTAEMKDKTLVIYQSYCKICSVKECSKVRMNADDQTVEAVAPRGTFTDFNRVAECS